MTLFLGPAVHHGYDPLQRALEDVDCIDPSILELPPQPIMTRTNAAGYAYPGAQPSLHVSSWTLGLPVDGQSFAPTDAYPAPGSDAAKSPGRNSHQQSSGRSEDTGSPISQIVYTPSSSYEYDAFANDGSMGALDDEDDPSKSPISDSLYSSTTDSSFYFVNYSENGDAAQSLMNPRPQISTPGASAQPSPAPSVAKSFTSNRTSAAQWTATLSAPNGAMSNNTGDAPAAPFGESDGFDLPSDTFSAQAHQDLRYNLMQDLAIPDNGTTQPYRNVTQISFRTFEDGTQPMYGGFPYTAGTHFDQVAPAVQQLRERQYYFANQYQQSQSFFSQHQHPQHTNVPLGHYTSAGLPATSSLMVNQSATAGPSAPAAAQTSSVPIRSHHPRNVVHQAQLSTSSRASPYPQSYAHAPNQVQTQQVPSHRGASTANRLVQQNTSTAPLRRPRILPREDRRPHVVPSNASAAALQAGVCRKGGRARHTRLADDVRVQTSKMRGVTACWRCALQRDKCDDGPICRRCNIRSQKGQRDHFGCDRSKLPEWIEDLLPLSMTDMHSKPSIEKHVLEQVSRWNTVNSIDIYLTSGYGPALMWRCCEFQPNGQELLGQLQYLQEASTGMQQRRVKYSPPFALERLDENDDKYFREYLDQRLMAPDILKTLGGTFYEEECMVDPQYFQAQVLDLMCTLYSQTSEEPLREALGDIIRMLIVTYIMGHTLTIAEDTLPTVLASVRYTPKQTHPEQHTSPRLANRQLKHYFSSLRHNTYLKVLHRQQQTFHDSKRKEAHWLASFCAMLGFAMVFEETQRTIQIQADARWAKGEMSQAHADAEALRHCQGIDTKFEKLVFFFQKKYRDRKWGEDGSFGHGTPNYRTLPESTFLTYLYELLLQRQEHLQSRASVSLGPEYQCKYTTRLVAKFLLPFLNLP